MQSDRNTTFFHMSTLVKRKKNKIIAIKNSIGEWLLDEREVRDYVQKNFQDIYMSSQSFAFRTPPSPFRWQDRLSNSSLDSLNEAISDEEIKEALWSMKASKAPGPDGFHARFFQRFWLIVGETVSAKVKRIFAEKKMPSFLNRTHIALIPKIQGLESLNNYRPISLCNSVYKIVTKIIVRRLRPFLGELISPMQSAFVPGRRGIDNAIIVQELIHTISRSKEKVVLWQSK